MSPASCGTAAESGDDTADSPSRAELSRTPYCASKKPVGKARLGAGRRPFWRSAGLRSLTISLGEQAREAEGQHERGRRFWDGDVRVRDRAAAKP